MNEKQGLLCSLHLKATRNAIAQFKRDKNLADLQEWGVSLMMMITMPLLAVMTMLITMPTMIITMACTDTPSPS
jgi:hypothetical protein